MCSNCLHLFDPLGSDGSSSLREGFEAALQSERHAFEQASLDHIGEGMPIQNSMKIRREPQTASDLSQTSEEDFDAGQLRTWAKVLREASIANDCIARDASQQKRRRRQTRRANHQIGLGGEFLL